jgi:membrane-bound metal-dependent hydrolase YbcI (DUF457 family)
MDLLSHVILPLAALVMFSLVHYRKIKLSIIILSIFAVLPDFDTFLGFHRGYFHNVFFLALFLLPALALLKFKDARLKKMGFFLVIISYYVFSHLVLDLTYGGIPIIYPISTNHIEINLEITTYADLRPNLEGFVRWYEPGQRKLWYNSHKSSSVKPGIIFWRNAFLMGFVLFLPLLIEFKKIKFENDFHLN